MSHTIYLIFIGIMISLFHSSLAVAACSTSIHIPRMKPDSMYKDYGDGTVLDTKTRLIWQKCSMGQTYSGGTCVGMATSYTWDQAMAAAQAANLANMYGHNDWRVPNIKEYFSLADLACNIPAINSTIFPNTMTDKSYRSSTLKIPASDSINQWVMVLDFATGSISEGRATTLRYLRLVRN